MKKADGVADIRIAIIKLLLCLLAVVPLSALAQTDQDVDLLRQSVVDAFDQAEIGAGYAAIVDFAVSRDISSATIYPDADKGIVDPTLVSTDEFIQSTWTTYGGSFAGGIELPFGEHFKLLPVASLGIGRIENRAKFYGPISESLLEPALSELVCNWGANTIVYGAALGADYRRDIGGPDVSGWGLIFGHGF